jgi:hypothetical protein
MHAGVPLARLRLERLTPREAIVTTSSNTADAVREPNTMFSIPSATRSIVWRALAVGAFAALIVALVALAFAGVRWGSLAATEEWRADRFLVAAGQGVARGGALVIERIDASGAFIATLPTAQLDSREYTAIEVDITGLPERTPVAILWRSRMGGSRTFTHPADIDTPRGVRAQLDHDPNWNGPISGIGVIVAGSPPRGATIVAVRAVSATAVATAVEAVKSWFRIEEWNGQSINVVFLGGQYHAFPFTLYVGLAMVVALVIWVAWQRNRGLQSLILGSATIAMVAWLLLDLRWLANLTRVEVQSAATLGGKSWQEKRLAAIDGPLFAFIQKVRELIAQRPGRVFFSSDDAWLRVRGGYHLLPFNTLAIAYHRNLFEVGRYRPGDWLCFYARGGVVYDPATQTLRWDGGPPLKAERVLAGVGQLYRVLP